VLKERNLIVGEIFLVDDSLLVSQYIVTTLKTTKNKRIKTTV